MLNHVNHDNLKLTYCYMISLITQVKSPSDEENEKILLQQFYKSLPSAATTIMVDLLYLVVAADLNMAIDSILEWIGSLQKYLRINFSRQQNNLATLTSRKTVMQMIST